MAINNFQAGVRNVRRSGDLPGLIGRFLNELDYHILHMTERLASRPDFERARGLAMLTAVYGQNGSQAANEIVSSGNEGGFAAVLRAVAQHVAAEYARNESRARIGSFWDRLSAAEKVQAGVVLLEDFGRYLPSELTAGSGARARAAVPEAFEKLAELAMNMRRVVPD
jgi:hypothetical protein